MVLSFKFGSILTPLRWRNELCSSCSQVFVATAMLLPSSALIVAVPSSFCSFFFFSSSSSFLASTIGCISDLERIVQDCRDEGRKFIGTKSTD